MVSNPVPLKPPPCLQADVPDAEAAIDRVPSPTSAVILVARAVATSNDRGVVYQYTCWTLVNSTIAYSTRFADRSALSAFVTRIQAYLVGKVGASAVVVADASSSTSALPCPPPEDAARVRSLIETTRAAVPR